MDRPWTTGTRCLSECLCAGRQWLVRNGYSLTGPRTKGSRAHIAITLAWAGCEHKQMAFSSMASVHLFSSQTNR